MAALSLATVVLAAGCDAGSGPTDPTASGTGPAGTGSTSPTAPAESAPTSPVATASGASSDTGPSPSAARPSCRDFAAELTLDERVGQLFMAGISSESISAEEGSTLTELGVGSVVLLGDTTSGNQAVSEVTDRVRSTVDGPDGVDTMIAADQEGGQIQRLAGPGFVDIPSAEEQAEMSDGQLRKRARHWGRQLDQAGVDANLAPVADVVPKRMQDQNEPIAELDRGYGSDPQQVADKNVAFIEGMHAAGIATSSKHFPGLGVVRGNTDFSTDTVDDRTTADDAKLAGFRAGVDAGTEMVMMSSATYTKIDAKRPALYSATIVEQMLREDLGFEGVVISDDLAGEALAEISPEQRVLRFIRAGGDLAIVGEAGTLPEMVQAVRNAAADSPKLRKKITAASTRVLTMKSAYGLARCG